MKTHSNKLEMLYRSKYILTFVLIFSCVLVQRFLNERQEGLANSVAADGLGYYCYLPAAVLYQDFSYSYYQDQNNHIKSQYKPYLIQHNGKEVLNKYYSGTAICLLPFFLLGIFISFIAGTDINGYTDTFLMLLSIAPIFYYLLATYLFSKIAIMMKASEKKAFIISLLFFFGTNFYYYVVQEPSMSHAYSFFAIMLFLYLFVRLIQNIKAINIILCVLTLALVTLIRPTNIIIILFVPFFFESPKDFLIFLRNIFRNHILALSLSLLLFSGMIFLQFIFYYLQTGSFFIVSYEGESFNFAKPELYNTFFSYRKGLFIYIPLFFIALGFIAFIGREMYKKIIFFITFFVFSYIASSWWSWWYGAGLSIRPFVDILPIILIAVLYLSRNFTKLQNNIAFALVIPVIAFNQIISYQYINTLIEGDSPDKEMFWDVFLKTNKTSIVNAKLEKLIKNNKVLRSDSLTFEASPESVLIYSEGMNSTKSFKVGKEFNYTSVMDIPIKDLKTNKPIYVYAESFVKGIEPDKNFSLVISVSNTENGNIVRWDAIPLKQYTLVKNGWTKMSTISKLTSDWMLDVHKISVLAQSNVGSSLVDNIKYVVFEGKE